MLEIFNHHVRGIACIEEIAHLRQIGPLAHQVEESSLQVNSRPRDYIKVNFDGVHFVDII